MEMSLTFDTMTKFNKKHTFWIGFIITFHMIYILFGFAEVWILLLFLVMM